MPKTVNGRILLGWMDKREALKTLMEEAVPPLTEEMAVEAWNCYKQKVAALGVRDGARPGSVAHNLKEKRAVERIIKGARQRGNHNIAGLQKIDPSTLVVHQLQIIQERSEFYRPLLRSPVERVRTLLPPLPQSRQLSSRWDGAKTIIKLPHSEFEMTVGAQKKLEITEQAQHVTVTAFDNRLLLWAGYHRTHAFTLASQEYPEEIERELPVVLTTDAERFLGPASLFPEKRDMVRGPCPALFRDFFDANLCMSITLRKRRCQIEIDITQARKVWVDDDE